MIISNLKEAVALATHIGRLHGIGQNFSGDFWSPTDDARELVRRVNLLRGCSYLEGTEQGQALAAFASALEAEISEREAGAAP